MTWPRLLLLCTTLLALALAPASATAGASVTAKTHVGVIDVAAALCIEAASCASLGEYRENRLAEYDGTSDVPHVAGGRGTKGESGRAGKQQRLRELANDPNTSKADRGWIKQEQNAMAGGKRSSIRVPPGKELAHSRGREAAKGYSHTKSPSKLQDKDLHRTQHKFDDFGRKNPERP